MSVRRDRPFEVQVQANDAMATVLARATGVAMVLGLVGVGIPGPLGLAAAWGAVGVVIAGPLSRVGWLAVRWMARGDRVFALLACLLLGVVAVGAVLAVLGP